MDIFCLTAIAVLVIIIVAWALNELGKTTRTAIAKQSRIVARVGIASELGELADLRDKKIITEDEFQNMKGELLNKKPPEQ